MQPHGDHQPRRLELGHGGLGILHRQQHAGLLQPCRQQPLLIEPAQQGLVLLLMERQPVDGPTAGGRELIESLQIGLPSLPIQLAGRPPAEHDRPCRSLPGLGRQRPDRITTLQAAHAPVARQLG